MTVVYPDSIIPTSPVPLRGAGFFFENLKLSADSRAIAKADHELPTALIAGSVNSAKG